MLASQSKERRNQNVVDLQSSKRCKTRERIEISVSPFCETDFSHNGLLSSAEAMRAFQSEGGKRLQGAEGAK